MYNANDSNEALHVIGGSFAGTASSSSALVKVQYNGHYPASTNCNSAGTPQTFLDVASIDQLGNLRLCGGVSTSVTPLVVHRTASFQAIGTYATQQSVPSVEDFGEAQLVNGQAYVRLDPVFATVIDPRANYLVFATPRGDSRGLYVTQTSLRGFAVRENQGGRSSVAFDYRIVAKPIDSNGRRLPLVKSLLGRGRAPERSLEPHYSAGYIPKAPLLPATLQH